MEGISRLGQASYNPFDTVLWCSVDDARSVCASFDVRVNTSGVPHTDRDAFAGAVGLSS